MHYKYYYYSREQLLANEENANQRYLVTIACEALLMTSALRKHIQKHTKHTRIHTRTHARMHASEQTHTQIP